MPQTVRKALVGFGAYSDEAVAKPFKGRLLLQLLIIEDNPH